MIQHTVFTGFLTVILIGSMQQAIANTNEAPKTVALITPKGHQAIKANVIDFDPATFTINVKKLANIGANEMAPTFAVYTSTRLPKQCADYRHLNVDYKKPSKYKRVFNLSDNRDVIDALRSYGCVVVKNKPPR